MEGLRKRFGSISNTIIAIVDAFGHSAPVTLRSAFCSMALGDGAAWLQVGDKLANPYYGQEMLGCGDFQRKFLPAGTMTEQRQEKGGRNEL